jgi:hypothetical protein
LRDAKVGGAREQAEARARCESDKIKPLFSWPERENITAEKSLRGADKKRVQHAEVSLPASAHRYNTWLIKLIEQEVTSPSLVRVTLSRLLPPSPGLIPFLLFKLPKRVFNCGFIRWLALPTPSL